MINPYSYWDNWNFYHKVVFDGPNKLIYISTGVTELDVQVDLYSDWKEWTDATNPDGLINARYLPAFRAVGGDPLPGAISLGGTYFLINGWRIQPAQGAYRLTVTGNLYTEEGEPPFIPADGLLNNILIESAVGTLVLTTGIGNVQQVQEAVWSADLGDYEDEDDTAGQDIRDIKRNTGLIPAIL